MTKGTRPICVADSETDPFKRGRIPAPFLWGFMPVENRDFKSFTDTDDFIKYVSAQRVICYAHNGGKFDFHFLLKYLDNYESLTIINGRIAKMQIGECEFRDSYCIIPAPLEAYKKTKIDYRIFERDVRNDPKNWQIINAYLEDDCNDLADLVENFVDEYGLGLTQAGSAMNMWARISGLKKPKTDADYYAEMGRYYYGGRVECFTKGIIDDEFIVIDIKSAYPDAMQYLHPWGAQIEYADNLDDMTESEISRSFIEIECVSTGVFPMRDKGLKFPADNIRRTFFVTGWEYLAARDTGHLIRPVIKSVRYFNETISFGDYVDHFFEMKQQAELDGDGIKRLFAKIFLNSLYGKFASNPDNYEEFMTVPIAALADIENDWSICKLISEDTAIVNRPLEGEKHRYYDVAVAASITGFVRAHLWRSIQRAGKVYYCDTDSIVCDHAGTVDLGGNLGQWEIEARCNYGAIAGKKLYAFQKIDGGFKIASKGVRLEPQQIIDIAKGSVIIHESEIPTFTAKGKIDFPARSIRMTA